MIYERVSREAAQRDRATLYQGDGEVSMLMSRKAAIVGLHLFIFDIRAILTAAIEDEAAR